MALKDQIEVAAVWTDSTVRGTNDTGTPITSAVLTGSGRQIADTYTLTVSSRVGSTGTVTVESASKNNPYNGRVKTGITFNSSAVTLEVVPGVSIVFATGGANGDVATVYVGDYKGSFDASGVDAGVPTDGVRHKVVNDGASSVIDCKAGLRTMSVLVAKSGTVFNYIAPFAPTAVEKTAGGGSSRVMPFAMEIENVSGAGGSKVADLLIDGVNFGTDQIQNVTTGELSDGTGLKAVDPPETYLVVGGDLEGLEFALSASCANTNTANILIFPSRYTQIAPDVSGAEGTYSTIDVNLTEVGQTTGVITAGNAAYYWVRNLIPVGASSESNPYPCQVALECSESSDAGWTV